MMYSWQFILSGLQIVFDFLANFEPRSMDVGLNARETPTHNLCDLLITAVLDCRENEHLAVLLRQSVNHLLDHAPELPRQKCFVGIFAVIGKLCHRLPFPVDLVDRNRGRRTAPITLVDIVSCDAEKPGLKL